MKPATPTKLRIGDWCVNPSSGEISRNGESARLEIRAMRLLLYLAERADQVVSIDELLDQVWSGVVVSPDSVYQAVTSLRRQLGDDPKQPAYIATVPRLGYRMVASINWESLGTDQSNGHFGAETNSARTTAGELPPPATAIAATPRSRIRVGLIWAAGGALGLALVFLFSLHGRILSRAHAPSPSIVRQPQNSVAVLPFLDLTEGMKEEEFADGITEELIDKFSKIPGLRVPPPTSSFYYKGKQVAVADIAKALGVAYVLDGSVRKSGSWVRVDARLIRADTGFIVWSQTYDQPMNNILMVQDDIAAGVTKALKASIAAGPDH
jgi:TolB-like protein/DNA-binding winged helix-turn-helix (wHTH) protein